MNLEMRMMIPTTMQQQAAAVLPDPTMIVETKQHTHHVEYILRFPIEDFPLVEPLKPLASGWLITVLF